MNIEPLLDFLTGDQLQAFAEEYCEWCDSDYYEDCLYDEETDEYYTEDDSSIVDSALDAIRDWAVVAERVKILEQYVTKVRMI